MMAYRGLSAVSVFIGVLIQTDLGNCLSSMNMSSDFGKSRKNALKYSCENRPQLSLLCPRGASFYEGSCHEDDRLNELEIIVEIADGNQKSVPLFEQFGYTVENLCKTKIPLYTERYPNTDRWKLLENGTISASSNVLLSPHQFFLNPEVNGNTSAIEYSAWTCYIYPTIHSPIYWMLVGIPFLVATFLIYAILPELHNNVHGKSIMCYLACLTMSYTALSLAQNQPPEGITYCQELGYVVYGGFISVHFWLNVISFDVWWNLRCLRVNSKRHERRQFMIYSAYAWGMPIVFVLVCYLMDNLPGVPLYMQPHFGIIRCFLRNKKLIEFLYFHLPIIVILTVDAVFFILIAQHIRRVQLEIVQLTSKNMSNHDKSQFERERIKYGLFLRLFIIMGLSWTVEIMNWVIDLGKWTFYISDVLNSIKCIVTFSLLIWRSKVKHLLVKRWHYWRGKDFRSSAVVAPSVSSQISKLEHQSSLNLHTF